MRREARYWFLLVWCALVYWPLRIAARMFGENGMVRIPRTVNAYLAWLGTLSPEQLHAVHQAADWFATVHARDMDALHALLMALEQRVERIENKHINGSD